MGRNCNFSNLILVDISNMQSGVRIQVFRYIAARESFSTIVWFDSEFAPREEGVASIFGVVQVSLWVAVVGLGRGCCGGRSLEWCYVPHDVQWWSAIDLSLFISHFFEIQWLYILHYFSWNVTLLYIFYNVYFIAKTVDHILIEYFQSL